jgi:hypothetical protein
MRGILAARPCLSNAILGIALLYGAHGAFAATGPAINFVTAPTTPASLVAVPSAGLVSAPSPVSTARPPTPQPSAPAPFRLRLSAIAPGPSDGSYFTNDMPSFMIDHLDGQVRLRFTGSDEVFYLTSEPASLGGRVLRYDTGDVALTVAGWGGITLYTNDAPWGVPAEQQPPAAPIDPPPVAPKDMKPLADKLAKDVALHGAFSVGFSADWENLAKQAAPARALAVDSLRNAAYALEQMASEAGHQAAVAKGVHEVRVGPSPQPGVAIQRDSLVVTYSPQGGPSARPSSLAIAHALEEAF